MFQLSDCITVSKKSQRVLKQNNARTSEFTKTTGHKINTQNSITFLSTDRMKK